MDVKTAQQQDLSDFDHWLWYELDAEIAAQEQAQRAEKHEQQLSNALMAYQCYKASWTFWAGHNATYGGYDELVKQQREAMIAWQQEVIELGGKVN